MELSDRRRTLIADYAPRIFFLICYVILIFNCVSYLSSRGKGPQLIKSPEHQNYLRQLGSDMKARQTLYTEEEERARLAQIREHQLHPPEVPIEPVKLSDAEYDKLPQCPEVSPLLKGLTPENLKNVTGTEYLETILPFLKGGGHRPNDCRAREKLAIIIPYRDRWTHLLIQIKNLAPLLARQQADYRIYVIEQVEGHLFNKAALLNVGYMEANKDRRHDCYVFQDVDMVPRNDRCLYRCAEVPIHLCANVSKWREVGGIPYDKFFGGAMAYSDKQWQDMNGASTLYFGWGLEDDDVRERSRNRGYKDRHFPQKDCYYDNIPHARDTGNTVNLDRDIHRKSWHSRQPDEGLNTMRYNIVKRDVKKLFTWVSIDIDQHDVLMHAPEYLKKDMAMMYNMPDILGNKTKS